MLNNSCSGGAHNVVNSSVLKSIREHIGSFAVMDSHYCRSQTQKKYLYPGLSINAMYRMYREKCETDGIKAGTLSNIEMTSIMNLTWVSTAPKRINVRIASNLRTPLILRKTTEIILNNIWKNKSTARRLKDEAKTRCNEDFKTAAAFDLEQILLCPHGQSSSFFYKRRLGVYNLTIYDYKKGDVYCYMWPEHEAHRGPNEVSTCLFNYIRDMASSGIKEIDLFSDNCPGQNRNRFVVFCLWYCRKQFELKRIAHTYLEKGHTETENDSVHATKEKQGG